MLGFSFTSLVVNSYKTHEEALANDWYARGTKALEAGSATEAVDDLETALIYSRDNYTFRLKLTDALIAAGNIEEAEGQLRAFWEQHPGDSLINLKLARIEANRKHVDAANRYYQNTIEGVWPPGTDPVPERIKVRFEQARYLLQNGRSSQAQSALFALGAVLAPTSEMHGALGDLFAQSGDWARALSEYQVTLKQNKNDSEALVGAAKASFALSDYTLTRKYLGQIQSQHATTMETQEMSAQLDRLSALDPFAQGVSGLVSAERTIADYRITLDRLARCNVPFASASKSEPGAQYATAPQNAAQNTQKWAEFETWSRQLDPFTTPRKLRGRDDVIESMMRFVFRAQIAADQNCGKATGDDAVLLLLAKQRWGSL